VLPEFLNLDIVTPEKRVVTQQVQEVVLPGSEGSLGVLPGHAPLLTALAVGELMYRTGTTKHYVAVAWGFAEVLPERVTVLAEIAERGDEIDRERAAAARDRAMERLKARQEETDFGRAQVALEKAVVRLQVSGHAHGGA
jgi:F-type H+-transporting ATPase subunit epsilon